MSHPLKAFSVSLLTALAASEAHAYAVQQQMISDVEGRLLVHTWAVYRELPRLAAAGLIEAVPGTRPLRYRLTKRGRTALALERERALHTYRLLQARL